MGDNSSEIIKTRALNLLHISARPQLVNGHISTTAFVCFKISRKNDANNYLNYNLSVFEDLNLQSYTLCS